MKLNFREVKNKVENDVEILAPVGGFDSLHAALNAGCNSVFFGVQGMNMRARSANNFTIEDLPEVVQLCNEKKVKTYLTVNTVLYDSELTRMREVIDRAKAAGITAVICSDMSAIIYANSINLPVHISTQLSVSNFDAVKFYAQYAETIVLARELTLPMVKKICDRIVKEEIKGRSGNSLKIEIFGHGAICVSISGRCAMSLLTDNSSANKGACMQPCRRAYRIIDVDTNTALQVENDYVLSPSDLCTIGMLDEIAESGIKIFKIEGRGRTADYVDKVVRIYKEAFDSLNKGTYSSEKVENWNKDLGTVFNRGFSDGFYMGKRFIEWCGVYGNKATEKKILVGTVKNYFKKVEIAEVELANDKLEPGDKFVVIGNKTGVVRGEVGEIRMEENLLEVGEKGMRVTFKVPEQVRANDRIYKLVKNDELRMSN